MYEKQINYYLGTRCAECPFKKQCTPKKDGCFLQVREGLPRIDQQVSVNLEIHLVCIGHNQRKLYTRLNSISEEDTIFSAGELS